MALCRGTVIDGRYRVLERVGCGSFAEVFLAEETRGECRRVALKVLNSHGHGSEEFVRELKILQDTEDSALVRVLGHGSLPDNGPTYLALEWIEGANFLEAARLLPVHHLRGLLVQLCNGLEYLHGRGIVHGDLKPSNVRVTRAGTDDDELRIKILDFGLARILEAGSGHDGGTLIYAAPELLRRGKVDGRADLYALGVLLYQVLTGTLPFDASDPAAVLRGHLEETPRPIDRDRTGAPADLAEAATRLLMKDPEDRFASAGELAAMLTRESEPPAVEVTQLAQPRAADLQAPQLVGRTAEVLALRRFLDGHPRGEGGPGMALVLGEGGIGKSRLLLELAELARARDLAVHQGSCHETGGEPFGAFLELLEWAVGLACSENLRTTAGDEGPEEALAGRYGPEVIKVVPRAFGERPMEPSPELQPRYERLRLIDAVGTFLLEVSKARPFVLSIEDLHWADDASADLVEYLLRNRARGRLTLAAAARPAENRALWLKESLEREGGDGSLLRLSLERLDEAAVAELVRCTLRLPEAPVDLAAHVLRETAGNPFFVVEMLRDLVEEGALKRGGGGWNWDEAALRRRPRPEGIAQALERRIARTSDREKWLLQALALIDRAVDTSLLVQVARAIPEEDPTDRSCPADRVGLEQESNTLDWSNALDRLRDRGLVVRLGQDSTPRFTIAHDAARDLVERDVAASVRNRVHFAAGIVLESKYGTDSEEQIERIAYHFIQAGDDDRSARYCMRAALKAQRLYSNEEAAYFLLQALKYHPLDDPVRWDALGNLGMVYLAQGKIPHARTRFDEMRTLAEGAKDSARTVAAHLGLSDAARRLSDYRQQMFHARVAFRIAQRSANLEGQADALQVLGLGHFNLGRIHTAIRCYNRALQFLRTTPDTVITRCVLNRMGLGFMAIGDFPRATTLFEDALKIATKNDRAGMLNNLGCIAESLGEYGDALRRYRSAGAIAAEVGNRVYVPLAMLNEAGILIRLNATTDAETLIHRALRMSVELGDRMHQGYLTVFLGQIHRIRRNYDDAQSYLSEAHALAERIGHLEIRLLAQLEMARLSLDRGDLDDATRRAESVLSESSEHWLREITANAAVLAGDIHRQRGDLADSRNLLERAWKILATTPYAEVEWQAHFCEGQLAELETRTVEAGASYQAAATILENIGTGIEDTDLRQRYLSDPRRLELRVKAARAVRARPASPPTRHLAPEHLEVLVKVGHALFKTENSRSIAELVADTTRMILGCDRVAVFLERKSGVPSATNVASDCPWSSDAPVQEEIVAAGWDGVAGFAVAHADPMADPLGELRELGVRFASAIPIPGVRGTQGVIYADGRAPVATPRPHSQFVESLATQAGMALSNCEINGAVAEDRSECRLARFGALVSSHPPMLALYEELRLVAESMTPVLIEGESGVGKELAAQEVHASSLKCSGPFVAIDCGALPEGLAEAELFGCHRGAFSGATESRDGLLAASDGGTLFLDEVGNLPLGLQAKLLRVLQTGEIRRLGGTRVKTVEFRLIAATNSELRTDVAAGRFRRDLYYRLAGIVVRLPPLRERPDDIRLLVRDLAKELGLRSQLGAVKVTEGAVQLLQSYDWPGNVRELRNLLAAMAAGQKESKISRSAVARRLPGNRVAEPKSKHRNQGDLKNLKNALARTGGDKTAAARLLGWSRTRVYRVLRRSVSLKLDS